MREIILCGILETTSFVEIKEEEMLACHRTPYILICPSVRVWKTIQEDSTCLMSLYMGNAEEAGQLCKMAIEEVDEEDRDSIIKVSYIAKGYYYISIGQFCPPPHTHTLTGLQ